MMTGYRKGLRGLEGIELTCFQIISAVGAARSMYIEAIQEAKHGKTIEAKAMIDEGNTLFQEGHHAHAHLIQSEASGNAVAVNLLLMHAEDQLMSAEGFRVIAEEFIDLYEILANRKELA